MSDGVYLNFDPEELWQGMQQTYVACGGDILYPGDPVEIGLRAALAMGVGILSSVEARIRSRTLRHATGSHLEEYGEDEGCPIIGDTAAKGRVAMTFAASGAARTIPAGLQMTADGMRFYATLHDIAVTGYAQTVGAEIACTQAGSLGNGISAGTEMQLAKNDPIVERIIVTEAISGGNDREEDDTYRERIRVSKLSSVTTGPSGAYEAQALAVSSQILDARTLNDGPCAVCTYLVFEDGADADALIADVLKAQNPDTSRPLNDNVRAVQAEGLAYTLDVGFTLPESATAATAQAISEAVSEYQAQQDRKLGMAFNPDMLVSKLYTAGAIRVVVAGSSTFNGGDAQYTAIGQSQYCLGTVNLTQNDE